jgi:DNA-binding beta-propeller fold protein YncE
MRVLRAGTILVLVGLVSSCATASSGSVSTGPAPLIVFPPPPDTARIQFLTAINSSSDVEDVDGSFVRRAPGSTAGGEPIASPYGLGIGRDRLYVCDGGRPAVEVIDLEAMTFDRFRPSGGGGLSKPMACFVDPSTQDLYILDTNRGQVVVFDSAGTHLGNIGETGDMRPSDVVVVGDTVFVSDLKNPNVRMYDRVSRDFIGTLLPPDPPKGEGVSIPMALASHGGRVYVSDMGGGRVKVYSTDGEYLQSIGSFGMGFGQFQRVKGIAVDGDQILYAVDAAFRNVQMFDGEGRLLMFFGGGDHGLTSPARVVLDYDHIAEFEHLVDPQYELSYLIMVTDLVGPDKVLVYGFVRPRQGAPGRP